MQTQIPLLKVYYDTEENRYGYTYNFRDKTKEDLIDILKELNKVADAILYLLGDKDFG